MSLWVRNTETFCHCPMTNAASLTHTHTCTPTFCHSHWQTHSHSHPLSNFPCVSAVSSLQCNSPRLPTPLATLRIIEYRSLAFAAVWKRVCLWTSVCLTGALQGHCHGNLSMGSSCCAVTEHRSPRSHEKGDKRGTERGLVSAAVFGVLEVERSHESRSCPIPPCIQTRPE